MKSVCFIEKQPLILFKDALLSCVKRVSISSQSRDCHWELAKDPGTRSREAKRNVAMGLNGYYEGSSLACVAALVMLRSFAGAQDDIQSLYRESKNLFYKLSLFSFIFLLLTSTTFAQTEDEKPTFQLTNSKPLNSNRYEDIKGSPYLFKDWVNATIITNDLIRYEDAYLNFNGYTKEFEIRQDDEYIELDRKFYLRIEILAEKDEEGIVPEGQDKLVFNKNIHQRFGDRMLIMIHQGKKVMVVKEFHVSISEKEHQDVGKTIVTKRFFREFNYSVIRGDELETLKLNKKGLINKLGNKSELESFIKKHKYKVENDADLREILAYYETL